MQPISASYLVIAGVCTYLIAYRYYSAFIAAKVMVLDDTRVTPAERVTTATTTTRRTGGCSSATTSPPSPAPAR